MQDFVAQQYDLIVIGGGTAGCVMASGLPERAAKQVLLIEAGENTSPNHRLANIVAKSPSSTADSAET